MNKYTEVNVMVTGQAIQLASVPTIASGGIKSVKVNFTFDGIWDGMAKTAVFYTNPKHAVRVLLEDDSAVVPPEILGKDGTFSFGVFGTNEEQVFPSVFVDIIINKGAASLQPVDPAEPTPDIYQQLTSAYAKMNASLILEKARIDEIVSTRGSDGAVEYSIESGGFVGTIKSNGVFAHIMLDGVPTLNANENTIISQLIPSRFAPLSVVELRCDYPGVTARIGTSVENAEYVNLIFINSTDAVIEDYISVSGEYALETVSIPELRDIRVAPNGTVYPTAGEAVRARRVPCIVDSGDPNNLADYTDEGWAAIGLLYLDEDNGNLYKCTTFTDGAYVWEPVGGGGSDSGAGTADYIVYVTMIDNVWSVVRFDVEDAIAALENGGTVRCRAIAAGESIDTETFTEYNLISSFIDDRYLVFSRSNENVSIQTLYVYGNGFVSETTRFLYTDKTLSISDRAADSGAVGQALGDISTALDSIIAMQEELIGV